MSELPPDAKKSSCTDTSSYLSAFAHASAGHRSTGVAGATKGRPESADRTCSPTARALTSTFPFAVSGSRSSTKTRFGTM
ncbi:hypothetical protein ACFYZB_20955 [Streptomyces sp. NPDC001852]|uniref:hypothetical protein n=1 Tax=Streptomyces sp. NPDC001852 TaxID=3364619 RepID=UPI0036B0C0A8